MITKRKFFQRTARFLARIALTPAIEPVIKRFWPAGHAKAEGIRIQAYMENEARAMGLRCRQIGLEAFYGQGDVGDLVWPDRLKDDPLGRDWKVGRPFKTEKRR